MKRWGKTGEVELGRESYKERKEWALKTRKQ